MPAPAPAPEAEAPEGGASPTRRLLQVSDSTTKQINQLFELPEFNPKQQLSLL